MRRDRRVFVVITLEGEVALLRQARDDQVARGEADLRALVEKDRRVLVAENFFGSLFLVEAAEPNLRSVGELPKPAALSCFTSTSGKARRHDLGQRVVPDRLDDVIEPIAGDQVTASGRSWPG